MNKIDKFLEMMVQRRAERAVLQSGRPYQVWVEGRKTDGAVTPFDQLRQILMEIAPQSQHAQIIQGGAFHFNYSSPFGQFDMGVEIFLESIQLTIAPARAVEVAAPKSTPLQPINIQPLAPQRPALPVAMQVFCQRCGAANNQGATFCSACGQAMNVGVPFAPTSVAYPQTANSGIPMQNIVNVSVQQKSSSSGWVAAFFVMMFATPLGCVMIPIAVLTILAFVSIGLWLLPSIVGITAASIIWKNASIPQEKKMPIVGGVLVTAGVLQLIMFLSYSDSVKPSTTNTEVSPIVKPL